MRIFFKLIKFVNINKSLNKTLKLLCTNLFVQVYISQWTRQEKLQNTSTWHGYSIGVIKQNSCWFLNYSSQEDISYYYF